MTKQKIIQELKKLGWKMITTVVLTLTAGATIWVYAAFVEPAAGPASSLQDFAQNILGADNNNNSFASTNVVANKDGSLIERQEYIANKSTWSVTALSALSGTAEHHQEAAIACYDLSAAAEYAMDGDTTTVYTDWRLPAVEELAVFMGRSVSPDEYLWTASPDYYYYGDDYWIVASLVESEWKEGEGYYDDYYFRCVR